MKDEFFVGYLPIPVRLFRFLAGLSAVVILAFAALSFAAGATQDDPGDGRFRGDLGRQTVTGVLQLAPIPLVRITEGTERLPAGHTLMLSAGGKNSLMRRARPLDGQLVTASGLMLTRGELDMLQVRGGRNGLAAAEGEVPAVLAPEPLGRWRLAGEICDGKCLAGAMRPGRGLAHKACANLCVIGDLPPIFVSTQAVEGSEYLLIAGPDGEHIPEALLQHMASFVRIEGDIERRGDLLIFRIDPATIEVL